MLSKMALVVLCLLLANCGGSGAAANGDASVPTVSAVFNGSTPSAANQTETDSNALPTLAPIFAGTNVAPTSAPASADTVPTRAPVFEPEGTAQVSDVNADAPGLPTLAPVFNPSVVATAVNATALVPLATSPARTLEPEQTDATPQAGSTRPSVVEDYVFDDALNPNWSLEYSENVNLDVQDTTHVKAGKNAIAVTFEQDFARAFFTVKKDSTQQYARDKTWGVTMWLNTGANDLGPEDLSVTVIGSNAQPYYVPNDTSVVTNDKMFFSETRLVYFGVSRQLPQETWIELTVELDNLPYDPDYKYITGIYVKNDKNIRGTIYLDRVAMLMIQ